MLSDCFLHCIWLLFLFQYLLCYFHKDIFGAFFLCLILTNKAFHQGFSSFLDYRPMPSSKTSKTRSFFVIFIFYFIHLLFQYKHIVRKVQYNHTKWKAKCHSELTLTVQSWRKSQCPCQFSIVTQQQSKCSGCASQIAASLPALAADYCSCRCWLSQLSWRAAQLALK